MQVAVVDYHAGNVFSVLNALGRLGIEPVLTDDAAVLQQADKVIFPGQGEAAQAMEALRSAHLDTLIPLLKQPLLGICIGQQLLCRHSEEGDVDCLGVFDVEVKRFLPSCHEEKVPHMGWNALRTSDKGQGTNDNTDALFQGLPENPFVYFIHSYYVPLCRDTIASTDYITPFSAALHRDNFYAVQFHPEKSGSVGEQILKNFLDIK